MQTENQPTITDDMAFDPIDFVKQITGFSTTLVYKAIRDDGFPEPYQFGLRAVRWKRSEVMAWMNSRPRGTRLPNTQRKKVA